MAGFKSFFIPKLSKVADLIPTPMLQKMSGQKLIAPFYHAISDEELPHIEHLYKVKDTKAFEADLDFLLKYYSPIDYKEFREVVLLKKHLQKPSFLLSFDDGLKEFHDVIAPILLKKGIPAICFLNSGFVDNKDLFYRYKASLIFDKLKNEPKLIQRIPYDLNDGQNIKEYLLSVTYQNKDLLNNIANLIGIDFSDFLNARKPYLSSQDISTLINQGFCFGAHSIDHPVFEYISEAEQMDQISKSTRFVHEKFGLPFSTFSFPFTDFNVRKSFFEEVKRRNIAEITFGCAGPKNDVITTNFQRIPFEVENKTAKQILNAELYYYLLKMPLGKNTLYRHD
jgi:peptidoglycan/xylan/chitin deacetylase (PgdA/CDA1 family)